MFFFLLQILSLLEEIPTNIVEKVIEFKFVTSPSTRQIYLLDVGKDLKEMVRYTIGELESALNGVLTRLETPMKISFNPIFDLEVPPGISLDVCGNDTVALTSILEMFYEDDPDTSVIVMTGCKSDPYKDTFINTGTEVPHIFHSVNVACSTRTLIFLELEKPKLLSVLSTALMRAAGVKMKNPLIFEEVNKEDGGITYQIHPNSLAIKELSQNWCYFATN